MLQSYQREERSIHSAFTEIASLLEAAPDLVLDLQNFFPGSAAAVNPAVAASGPGIGGTNLVQLDEIESSDEEIDGEDSDGTGFELYNDMDDKAASGETSAV